VRERTIYWIVGGIFGVLLIVMLAAWNYDRQNEEADAKAAELIAAYEAAGLRAPDQDQIAGVLGDDGGAVCDAADGDVLQGYWKQRFGVGGEFYFRPVKVDRKVVQGLLLVVRIYCPEELPDVEDFVEDLDFDDVIRD
jgi:hypothetical protein